MNDNDSAGSNWYDRIRRRDFIATACASSVIGRCSTLFGDGIVTDADGLSVREVIIPVDKFKMPAYVVSPDTGGAFPVVVVLHDVSGVTGHLKDVCRRFAKLGYLAVMPDLFAREVDFSKLDVPEKRRHVHVIRMVLPVLTDDRMVRDCDAAISWSQRDEKRGDVTKVGVCGFGWGGRIAWQFIAQSKRCKAAAIWWGRLDTIIGIAREPQPIDLVSKLNAPVIALFGAHQEYPTVEFIENLQKSLKESSKVAEVVTYLKAKTWFFDDTMRGFYRKEDAEDGWKRMCAWFREHEAG
jgi:carboxymethylenebutenolidase